MCACFSVRPRTRSFFRCFDLEPPGYTETRLLELTRTAFIHTREDHNRVAHRMFNLLRAMTQCRWNVAASKAKKKKKKKERRLQRFLRL